MFDRNVVLGAALLAGTALCSPAIATPTLLATGVLTLSADLSGRTETLENGVDRQNAFGGVGSGLTYAGGNTFLAVPDRGPNATAYNANVDDTTSYIQRFHTLNATLSFTGGTIPFTLTPQLTQTTLLSSASPLNYGATAGLPNGNVVNQTAGQYYFTGRSDNFAGTNSGNPANARLDTEAIRVSNDGKTVFVSDEYGPYIYRFDRATGQRTGTITLPSKFFVQNESSRGAVENSSNTTGRTANRGMEGLAITPDGKTLVGAMQGPLLQDPNSGSTGRLARIVVIDVATGLTIKEVGYRLDVTPGISEIVAINDHEFLVLERDNTGAGDVNGPANIKKIFRIDVGAAADISNLTGAAALAAAATKTQILDIVGLLSSPPYNIPKSQIPSKLEGLSFGPDVTFLSNGQLLTEHTLWLVNDNDFVPNFGGANSNPNQLFVFGVTDADLGAVFQAQQFVPEPATFALLLPAMAGLAAFRRRQHG